MRLTRKTTSAYFWPVPAKVGCVDRSELDALIAEAEAKGFSRKARGIEDQEACVRYAVAPVLFEQSPEPAWVCLVVGIPGAGTDSASGRVWSGRSLRLDVSTSSFSKMKRMKSKEKSRLINHFMAAISKLP